MYRIICDVNKMVNVPVTCSYIRIVKWRHRLDFVVFFFILDFVSCSSTYLFSCYPLTLTCLVIGRKYFLTDWFNSKQHSIVEKNVNFIYPWLKRVLHQSYYIHWENVSVSSVLYLLWQTSRLNLSFFYQKEMPFSLCAHTHDVDWNAGTRTYRLWNDSVSIYTNTWLQFPWCRLSSCCVTVSLLQLAHTHTPVDAFQHVILNFLFNVKQNRKLGKEKHVIKYIKCNMVVDFERNKHGSCEKSRKWNETYWNRYRCDENCKIVNIILIRWWHWQFNMHLIWIHSIRSLGLSLNMYQFKRALIPRAHTHTHLSIVAVKTDTCLFFRLRRFALANKWRYLLSKRNLFAACR